MNPVIIAPFLAVIVLSTARAQEQTEQSKPPATKLEAFQERTGVVMIRGYTTVGAVRGVQVDAREFRDASNPKSRAAGISISVYDTTDVRAGRPQRKNTSYVDLEEIDSLVKGIEYVAKIGRDVTALQNFEADYRTKDNLRIGVFNDDKGNISAIVESGRIAKTTAFMELSQLDLLRKLILAARDKL